jgi:hypothetical protein
MMRRSEMERKFSGIKGAVGSGGVTWRKEKNVKKKKK